MRVVVAGGTGFLGTALVARLRQQGHHTVVLTRRPAQPDEAPWNPAAPTGDWIRVLDGADALVNLAGASIAKRWTRAHKQEMWHSRVVGTRTLVAAMRAVARPPAILLNGSAVGIYGDRGDEPLTEESAPGHGFLADLAREWEEEAMAAASHAQVVLLRTGIALDREGGALPQMALPFSFFAGGPLGSGRQYFSWVHRDDWVSMVMWALGNAQVAGPLNVTAPHPVKNADLARSLGRVLRRPAVMPAPAFAIRLALGEMAESLLGGQRVLPARARALGFDFEYPTLDEALREIYGRSREA